MIEIKPEYAAAMAGGMKVMEYASMRNFQSIDNDELIRQELEEERTYLSFEKHRSGRLSYDYTSKNSDGSQSDGKSIYNRSMMSTEIKVDRLESKGENLQDKSLQEEDEVLFSVAEEYKIELPDAIELAELLGDDTKPRQSSQPNSAILALP